MLALLSRASVLVSPDSGPVHMATMVGTPVVGLYAATNPARSGPYLFRPMVRRRVPPGRARLSRLRARRIAVEHKIEEPGVMDLISVEQVTAKLDELLGSRP